MFEKVSKYISAAISILCIVIKKREDKAYQHQSFQRFFGDYTNVKHIPDSDSLQLSQKQINFKIHSLTKNLFRLNIFAILYISH